MLIFGHAGLTLGAAVLLNHIYDRRHCTRRNAAEQPHGNTLPTPDCTSGSGASWLTSLSNRIDIRVLFIGSILPDIIDKPVGHLFFSNGRVFCHTLLFLILITLAGICLYRARGKNWLLVLSFGTFIHLICDQMWRNPQTLFWPFYGFAFEKLDISQLISNIFHGLFSNPGVYVPELVGAAILLWFADVLVHRRTVWAFIRSGRIS